MLVLFGFLVLFVYDDFSYIVLCWNLGYGIVVIGMEFDLGIVVVFDVVGFVLGLWCGDE